MIVLRWPDEGVPHGILMAAKKNLEAEQHPWGSKPKPHAKEPRANTISPTCFLFKQCWMVIFKFGEMQIWWAVGLSASTGPPYATRSRAGGLWLGPSLMLVAINIAIFPYIMTKSTTYFGGPTTRSHPRVIWLTIVITSAWKRNQWKGAYRGGKPQGTCT